MSVSIFSHKTLDFNDYTPTILQSGVPWDELALMIFSWMYEIHIFFFMGSEKFWSTNLGHRCDDCQIWLLHRGGLTFNETEERTFETM